MDARTSDTLSDVAKVIDLRREILTKIKMALIDGLQLEYTVDDIDDDTFLFGSGLALDSIDAMEIVIGMETCFGVTLPDGDIAAMRTINTLADFVQSHIDQSRSVSATDR